MNAAINRSERRAFVAQFRTRRTLRILCLVVFALLPFATALIFTVSGVSDAVETLRIAALLSGVIGLPLLTLSLVPFTKMPSLANLFTASGLARTERFFGLSGVVLCLGHLCLSFRRLPDAVRIVPVIGANFDPVASFAVAVVLLIVLALLWLLVDPWRGGLCALLRALRFCLTALTVVFALLQLVHLTETRLPRVVLYELIVLLVLALIVSFFSVFAMPLRHARRFEVVSVEPLGADAVEATFEAESGRSAADYLPGQSAGVGLGGGTFSAKPLFYLSDISGNRVRIAFPSEDGKTALGGKVRAGAAATLDFGRGIFDMRRLGPDGFVFIVDGFGIAAAVAMLRALAEKRDRRDVTLFIGESASAAGWFQEELRDLEERLRLKVVKFEGAVALIGENLGRYDYFVCGSKSLRKDVKRALKGLKIPTANQWYEEI